MIRTQLACLASLLCSAAVAHAQSLSEKKARLEGALVGRIEIFQSDNTLHVAFAENRAGGTAVMTRGGAVWKLAGKWSSCQHGEVASYCQLAGSSSVYRFDRTMTREDRAQPTALLAATATGYAARVATATGDTLVHHAGAGDQLLAKASVAAAWSSGPDVSYLVDAATLREITVATGAIVDRAIRGGALVNVDRSSGTEGYRCVQTASYCGEDGLEKGCFITEYDCTCESSDRRQCRHGQRYHDRRVKCGDPRVDEPTCGGDPFCPGAIAFDADLATLTGMCGGVFFGYECDLRPGGPCVSLPVFPAPSIAPPDVQITTAPVAFAGVTLATGTPVTVSARPSGDVILEVP